MSYITVVAEQQATVKLMVFCKSINKVSRTTNLTVKLFPVGSESREKGVRVSKSGDSTFKGFAIPSPLTSSHLMRALRLKERGTEDAHTSM
jgi:hypothetical protein